jgi:hypothetical protein
MRKNETAKRATRFLAELNANVDAWYAGRVDYETFGARQRAIWDAIHAAGAAVAEKVLRALRERMPTARATEQGRA